jgi:hypothetical protein
VIAAAILRVQDVIAEAEAIRLGLAGKVERMQRRSGTGGEQMDRIAFALRLKELPHRADLHEAGSFTLHFLYLLEQIEGFRVALGQEFFEVALEAQMPAVEHEGVDVAPDLVQVRDIAHAAVEVRNGRNRDASVDL